MNVHEQMADALDGLVDELVRIEAGTAAAELTGEYPQSSEPLTAAGLFAAQLVTTTSAAARRAMQAAIAVLRGSPLTGFGGAVDDLSEALGLIAGVEAVCARLRKER